MMTMTGLSDAMFPTMDELNAAEARLDRYGEAKRLTP